MKQMNITIGAFQILILIIFMWSISQARVTQGNVGPGPGTGPVAPTVGNENTQPETNQSATTRPPVTVLTTTEQSTSLPEVTRPATTTATATTATTATTAPTEVTEEPDLTFIKYPVDIDTVVGMPITLRCQVQGKHEPTISWHKDNKSLDADHVLLRKESIRIRSAVSSDQGIYTCVARNSIGKVETRDAKVTVSTAQPLLCGQRKKAPGKTKRIVGGNNATDYWPWQVLVEYPNQRGNILCGGTLIGRRWVLTAAHCTHGRMFWYLPRDLRLRAGVYNRSNFDRQQQVLEVARIITHPKYQWGKSNFDIALLQLKHRARSTDEIGTICLPESAQDTIASGTPCVITGWGHTKLGNSHLPEVLQEAEVPIVSHSHCNRPAAYNKKLPKRSLCAGYDEGGKDTCQNDSGGPLACYEDDKWVLRGVTNSGIKCALPNKYGIYAQVSKYVSWISKEMDKS